MLGATSRLPLDTIKTLIAQENYFALHAPRQIGKTTAMLALAQQLNQSGQYVAITVSVEVGAPFRHDPGAAELAILDDWRADAEYYLPAKHHPPTWPEVSPGQRIRAALSAWSKHVSLPLVVFIDEIDTLQDEALLSALRQIRSGFPTRPKVFPQSIALIGLRDVRDYKVAAGGSTRLNTASPFNIKAESLTLRNFSAPEVVELYHQHTAETAQTFTPEALALAFDFTQGQPWLVNALARQLTEILAPDPTINLTAELVEAAKEALIKRQDTHLDSLEEKLLEPRVQSIIDLGLCQMDPQGGMVIANPIYREILPRALATAPSASLPQISPSWLMPNGDINLDALREAFLAFWLQHGEPLLGSAPYHEIAPHLVLMAFLHRVVNGGGTLEREYAIGQDRMDLCLRYGVVTLGIEIKVWRERQSDPLTKGKTQLDGYLARLKQASGWLIIFDRRSNAAAIEERISWHIEPSDQGRQITAIRA
jgi:hypothetical protein